MYMTLFDPLKTSGVSVSSCYKYSTSNNFNIPLQYCIFLSKRKKKKENMGNCQAIDTATLVIQQPNGKEEKLYWPVSASEVMKSYPDHYVALLISTTLCTSKDKENCSNKSSDNNNNTNINNNNKVRITRIKLMKPTDTLLLGQVYRLISTQEVTKGMWAKKQAKMKRNSVSESEQKSNQIKERISDKAVAKSSVPEDNKETKSERHESRTKASSNGGGNHNKSRTWQPSLQSITESAS